MTLEFKRLPDANKSFVENYLDHLSFFYKSRNGTNIPSLTVDDDVLLYMPIPLKPIVRPFGRFNVYKSMHDRYDYVDEIIGATIAPIACVLASVYLFTKAGANLLTLAYFTDEPYFKATIGNFCYSILALGIAAYCFFKSILSLIIRPLLTLTRFNPSEEERFCTGINDMEDFKPNHGLYKFSPPPTNISETDYNAHIELEWHKNIRPMLGFGNCQ